MTLGTKEAPFKPTARQWSACQEELKDPYGAEADAAEERGDPLPELAGRFFAFGQMLKGRSSERRDPVDFARDALKLCVVAAYRLGDFEESIVSLTDASLNSTRMSVVRVPVGQTPGGTRIVFWAELHACDDAVRWRFELVDLELVDLRPDRDE